MCCSSLRVFIGNLLFIIEKLAACCAATAVISCVMATLLLMLGLGVGLGYNYCFVDFKTKPKTNTAIEWPDYHAFGRAKQVPVAYLEAPENSTGVNSKEHHTENLFRNNKMTLNTTQTPQEILYDERNTEEIDRTVDEETERTPILPNFLYRGSRTANRTSISDSVQLNPTIVVLLSQKQNLSALLSKIQAQSRNITLEFIS